MNIEILQWVGGVVGALFTAYVGMRAERYKAQRDEKAATKDKDADAWNRVKETMGLMRQEIQELRSELTASEKASATATDDCDKRVAAVRAEFTADLDQAYSKVKTLSKICFEQQIEMDMQGIKLSKLERAKIESEPLPGGRRSTDDPIPTQRG